MNQINLNDFNKFKIIFLLTSIYLIILFFKKNKNKETFTDNKIIDFNKSNNEYDKYIDLSEKEKNIINDLNNKSNMSKEDNILQNINLIIKKTTNTLVNIINDIINIKLDDSVDNYAEKYISYSKNVVNIIFQKGRMFYIGIFTIVLSILVSFIEITK